jgi:hypothetical protein
MNRFIILLICLIPFVASAQTDLLVLKKKGALIHTYTVGDALNMETVYGQWFNGIITAMKHDTVFVNGLGFDYKEIKTIRRTHYNFGNTILPAGMFVAAGGILILNAVNGAYRHDEASTWYTHSAIVTSIALVVGGFILTRTRRSTYHLGHKFTLDYLELTFKKPPGKPF